MEAKKIIQIFERLFKKVIQPKYPFLTNIEFDSMDWNRIIRGTTIFANITTSKCLEVSEQEEIDTEFKNLYKLVNPQKNDDNDSFTINKNEIKCFFDCGDGEGFNFSHGYGYKH